MLLKNNNETTLRKKLKWFEKPHPQQKLCLFCWYTAAAVEWVRFNSGFLMHTTLLNENQDMMNTGAPVLQSRPFCESIWVRLSQSESF